MPWPPLGCGWATLPSCQAASFLHARTLVAPRASGVGNEWQPGSPWRVTLLGTIVAVCPCPFPSGMNPGELIAAVALEASGLCPGGGWAFAASLLFLPEVSPKGPHAGGPAVTGPERRVLSRVRPVLPHGVALRPERDVFADGERSGRRRACAPGLEGLCLLSHISVPACSDSSTFQRLRASPEPWTC